MLQCAKNFYDLLNAKELYATVQDDTDESIIRFQYQNKTTTFIFSGDEGEYVSIYTQYESVPEDKFADCLILCNELNAEYKWLKFYIDSDNDLMVQDDALLSPSTAADECFELLLRRVRILDNCKAKIMRAIYA